MIEQFKNIINEYLCDEDITITEDTDLIADLGFNSMDLVSLACTVEDEFNIEIPDRAIKDFKTIGDVIEFVEKSGN